MYLYFFDIDDTICDTKAIVEKILIDIEPHNFSKNEITEIVNREVKKLSVDTFKLLNNSTLELLQHLLKEKAQDIYYITARPSEAFLEDTQKWLKSNDLWLDDSKLIMDSEGIKGKLINQIMQANPQYKFAFLFDDLMDNHKEAATYSNIISCLP